MWSPRPRTPKPASESRQRPIRGLKRRENHAPVYLLERDGELMLLVLPMRATGYQSTITAMLALQPDLRTVAALTITEQGDTPGLGARIEEPDVAGALAGQADRTRPGRS